MNKKGSLSIETAVVFPMFLILLITLILALAAIIDYEKSGESDLIAGIQMVDSIKRKALILDDVLE